MKIEQFLTKNDKTNLYNMAYDAEAGKFKDAAKQMRQIRQNRRRK